MMNEIAAESISPHRRKNTDSFDRRVFLKRFRNAALAAAGLGGWVYLIEPYWLSVEQHPLKVPNLPASLEGKRLVHISDLHSGKVSSAFLQRAMELVNSLEPDFLIVTGDFVDASRGMIELDEVLGVLQPAKIHSLGCLGNHDYGKNYSQLELANEVQACARAHGIEVLRNEKINVAGIDFVGLDDFWSPRFRVTQVMDSLENRRPNICLCHNPDVCDQPIWNSFQGVILAGHTHGGQCKPPFLPPPILPVRNRRYTQGFIDLDSHRQLFISRGLGHTYRVRFNCRPEITVFHLTGKNQD